MGNRGQGGTEGVTSEEGKGSDFYFRLPVKIDRESERIVNRVVPDDHLGGCKCR